MGRRMTNSVADSPLGAEFALDPAVGTGNWKAYTLPLELMFTAAELWKQQLEGVEKPWLCWNVSGRWCLLQQKLVRHVGWTPRSVLTHASARRLLSPKPS
jgi:hypothetical protein